jgi:Skp family chaperone for outer membrane proteins
VGTAIWFASRLAAQAPAPAPAGAPAPAARPLQTRIGLMNMVQVLKHYRKFQALEDNIKKRATELEKSLEPFRTELVRLRSLAQDPKTTAEEREKIEHRMRQLQVDAQNKEDEAKKELIRMNGDAATMIYKEVEAAVSAYARANNLELVLFYNDAVTEEDYYHPVNLQRKLTQPAAVMPLFVTPGMDISNQIVNNLNLKYAPTASTTGAPAAPAAPTAPAAPPR